MDEHDDHERLPFNKVSIEGMWEDFYGDRWCFLFVDGEPWLSCEEDA